MALAGTLTFTGCTDMLEKEPLDQFVDNPSFWNDPNSVEGYAGAFYNLFTGYGNGGGSGDFYFPTLNDNQVASGFANWKFTNVPAESSDWSATWTEIRRANAMIHSLSTQATDMDASTKAHWLGVARLMRGWQYWDLVRKFGDCPWINYVPDIDDPVLYAAREDRDIIMDSVLNDLNYACENIQDVTSKTTWSRNLAYAMTSDICLWEGTFRTYRTEEDNGKGPDAAGAQRFLNRCVEVSEILMDRYSLCDNYQSIYNSESLAGNPEIIFCKEYKKDYFSHSLIDYTCTTTMQSGMSKDAFDAYLFLDGKTYKTTSYDNSDEAVMKLSANDGLEHLNIKDILANRDRRLAVTIDTVLSYPNLTQDAWPRVTGGNGMTSASGYTVAKYDNVALDPNYRQQTGDNYTWAPLYWLSVVYLNFAEAKAELGTLTDNDLNKSINLLKARAGLPPITTAVEDMGDNDDMIGVTPLIYEIRRERRCELMFDNDFRYWDLIRWHVLDKLDSSKHPEIMMGANVLNETAPGDGLTTVSGVNPNGQPALYIEGSNGMTRTYEAKHYLYPIPSGQITLNPNLGQNQGWGK